MTQKGDICNAVKILVLCSYAKDTGNWLRTVYLAEALKKWAEVELVESLPRCLPFRLDIVLSLPIYLFKVACSDADFMIAVKPFPNTAIPLLLAKYVRKKRIAVDIDDVDHGYLEGIPARIISALQRPVPKLFDLVTYHNERLADFIADTFKVQREKLYRLEQGVDLETFRVPDVPCKRGSLFFMGHLDVASSLGSILAAVREVQERHDAPFTIAGGGRLSSHFKAMADSLGVRVRFTGPLTSGALLRELARADICLVYYDPIEANAYRCSMKLREYLAMEKKVVTNDVGELADFARFTYQSSSRIEDFATTIERVLEGGDGREIEGARFVRERYDWRAIGERFYRRIVDVCGVK